jgi:hypothetical protein
MSDTIESLRRERDVLAVEKKNAVLAYERIREQLATMTAERDRLQTIDLDLQMSVQKLTASQAREQQLREALKEATTTLFACRYSEIPLAEKCEAILALPHDDTALKQWGAKLLRDAVNRLGLLRPSDRKAILSMADELEKP